MLKEEERVCTENLRSKREYYLKFYEKDSAEYKKLESLFNKFEIAYYEYAKQILGVPMMPQKPMDAYIAGGMANGIAGLGAGVGTFLDAKAKEEKYNVAMTKYDSKIHDTRVATIKLKNCYGHIVNFLKDNPQPSMTLPKELKTTEPKKYEPVKRVVIDSNDAGKKLPMFVVLALVVAVIAYSGTISIIGAEDGGAFFVGLMAFIATFCFSMAFFTKKN